MQPLTILIAIDDTTARTFLAEQLDADGHTVHEAATTQATIAKLSTHPIDVAIIGALERPAHAPALLRQIRAGRLTRIHPAQPVITIGGNDDLTALRSYDAGSDHHLPTCASYLIVRAVIRAVARRVLQDTDSRHVTVGQLHIDTAARAADVNGTPVRLSRIQFDILARLASDPTRVVTKHELSRAIWGPGETRARNVDGHTRRLRSRLAAAGANELVQTRWGQGYTLTDGEAR